MYKKPLEYNIFSARLLRSNQSSNIFLASFNIELSILNQKQKFKNFVSFLVIFKVTLIIVIYALLISCSDQGSNPVDRPDTTSHSFSIQKFEWGAKGSSVFLDVAIINDTSAWAVGEIFLEDSYTFDSLGNWIEPYNAAHWDGINWELIRVPVLAVGSNDKSHAQLRTIFALNENKIIMSEGGILIFYNGNTFTYDTSFNSGLIGGIRKIWASSLDNIFIVGTNGMMAHFDGLNWRFLNSKTEMWVMDIWGKYNSSTNEYDIYCPVTLPLQDGQPDLLRIKNDFSVVSENWPYKDDALYSVWFQNIDKIFLSGAGVYTYNGIKKIFSDRESEIPRIILTRVRGNNENDIFVCGHFGFLAHYNGTSWREYTDFNEIDHFWGLDYKNDLTIAAGDGEIKAYLYVLWRIK
jgi:hypothetical protein